MFTVNKTFIFLCSLTIIVCLMVIYSTNHVSALLWFFISIVLYYCYAYSVNNNWIRLILILWYARSITILFYLLVSQEAKLNSTLNKNLYSLPKKQFFVENISNSIRNFCDTSKAIILLSYFIGLNCLILCYKIISRSLIFLYLSNSINMSWIEPEIKIPQSFDDDYYVYEYKIEKDSVNEFANNQILSKPKTFSEETWKKVCELYIKHSSKTPQKRSTTIEQQKDSYYEFLEELCNNYYYNDKPIYYNDKPRVSAELAEEIRKKGYELYVKQNTWPLDEARDQKETHEFFRLYCETYGNVSFDDPITKKLDYPLQHKIEVTEPIESSINKAAEKADSTTYTYYIPKFTDFYKANWGTEEERKEVITNSFNVKNDFDWSIYNPDDPMNWYNEEKSINADDQLDLWNSSSTYTSPFSEDSFTNFVDIYISLTSYPSSIFLILFLLPIFLCLIYFICNYLSHRIKKK